MDTFNINDVIRSKVVDTIDGFIKEGNTFEESICLFRDLIYEYDMENILNNNKFHEKVIALAFCDAIKILLFKIKNGIVSDDDMIKFNCIKDIEDYSNLYAEVSADSDLFSYLLKQCYNFCKINYFGRINIIKSLSETENYWLTSINPQHFFDLTTYGIKVELDDIIKYFKVEVDYQNKNFDNDMSDINVLNILGLLKNLIKFDYNNFLYLSLEIASIDYSVCKFLLDNNLESDNLLDHVDVYENYSSDFIINKLTQDDAFLKNSIWMFYSLYIDKCYGDIKLTEEIMNSDYTKTIKKKLVI